MLEESPLIELYKNTRIQVEGIFHLDSRTTRHSAPDMETTFKMLGTYMEKNRANEYVAGRTCLYSIPDVMASGMNMLATEYVSGEFVSEDLQVEGDEGELDIDGNDGDLDV